MKKDQTTSPKKITVFYPLRNAASENEAGKANLRVAAYCRVSSESDEQRLSNRNQVLHFERTIAEHLDYVLSGIYADEGISGTSLRKRDAFNRLMQDARAGKIDLIITKSFSRFGRNTVDCLNCIRELKALGVDVYFEKENIHTLKSEGELLLTLLSATAQAESEAQSENVKWGIRRQYERGRVGSVPLGKFLGYRKDSLGNLVIDEPQAETVRLIYQLFLDGFGTSQIAKRLTKDKVPMAYGGKEWCPSHIMKVLTNEKMKGDTLFQKSYNTNCLTKRRAKNRGELPKYYAENTHPAIIDQETWALVQLELKRQTRFIADHQMNRYHQHEGAPLSGKIICPACRHPLQRNWGSKSRDPNRYYWCCMNAQADDADVTKPGDCPNKQKLLAAAIEQAFVDAWNRLVDGGQQIEPVADETDPLIAYRAHELVRLIGETGRLDVMSYRLLLKVLDHILVKPDQLTVVFLTGIQVIVPMPAAKPKPPRWTHTRKAKSGLAKLRMAQGLTQQALGDMLGVDQQYIHAVESGHYRGSQEAILKISEVLGVDWRDYWYVLPDKKVQKPPTRLKEIRLQKGYGQTQIAKIIGMDRKHYCRIEAGMIHPSPNMANRISQALGVLPEDWLETMHQGRNANAEAIMEPPG